MPKPETKLDITSATDFPSLFKSAVVMPNMVLMPKTLPPISFADKVKQMALAEETTKAQAATERIRKQQEEQREQFERERYVPFHSAPSIRPPQDTWDTPCEDEWTPGTPEFGREEFMHEEEDNDWSNT